MGKVKIHERNLGFTKLQKSIFDEFAANSKLTKTFYSQKSSAYFTGGTALSVIYLNHRESEDLDFFSERGFDNLIVREFIDKIAKDNKLKVRFTEVFSTRIFNLVDSSKKPVIKIDFNYYPYSRVERGMKVKGVEIDSLKDIAINKLAAINDRFEVKDYVDLYFLLEKFDLANLTLGVKSKFRLELDSIMVAANFLKAEQFEYLPKMKSTLKLSDLKKFFTKKAQEMAMTVIKNT